MFVLKKNVLYEFPLNERIRVFMRLEQLFHQIDYFMEGDSIWESRVVISTLLEILTIFSRNDIKSEILKEVDRQIILISKNNSSNGCNPILLSQTQAKLNEIGENLYRTPGKIGGYLMENDLFKCISQRSSIPGGTCVFDLPAYHYWLQQSEAKRKQDLLEWIKPFQVIRIGIGLLLEFIRNSAPPTFEKCNSGFFQKTLDHNLPFQLIRVGLYSDEPYFAEISGGKHRFTIRFMCAGSAERPVQTKDSLEFQLTCCLM